VAWDVAATDEDLARPVLLTGAAGFIGFHVARRFLDAGRQVIGLDCLSPYYDPALKEARLAQLRERPGFHFVRGDLTDLDGLLRLVDGRPPAYIVHLAAQPGVRYSREAPRSYIDANILGFFHVLEVARKLASASLLRHVVFASTSSVYGGNTRTPLSEHQGAEHPLSLYAATKKANEAMAHAYSHLYGIALTGLRFFTVYGPWGRPDMAPFKFTRRILAGEPIELYNHGQHSRDFTFVEDVAEAVFRITHRPARPNPDWRGDAPDPASSPAPYRIYNVGNSQPVALLEFIRVLEGALGREAQKQLCPAEPGDVLDTLSDSSDLAAAIGFRPQTAIAVGVARFVEWYRAFYAV
jgi:UDP-glucuronate 4-epimerase